MEEKCEHRCGWEIGCAGVDWICVAQVRKQWRAVVNAVMNTRVTQM
jgi:hypothetical protein